MEQIDTCPACSNHDLQKKFLCEDYTVSHETFHIEQCNSCNLGITTPRPTENDLYKYYLSENYISHSGKPQTIIEKIYLIARHFTLNRKLRLINNLQKKKGKILDYGCGTGEFLLTCKNDGWDIAGVEPSESARKKASDILSTELNSNLQDNGSQYDVITLWHVLEHVPNLKDTLTKISNRLKPNGTILVAVPNYTSYDGIKYQKFWAGFDVPRHLWHFSPESMKQLLETNSLSLQKTKPMTLDAYYISLLSEKYKRGRQSISGMITAFFVGTISNIKARKNGKYSSLIYIIKK